MAKQKRKKPVPSFATIAEAAEFWDTHSSADYEWKEVPNVKIIRPVRLRCEIKIEPTTGDALARVARKRRTTPDRLADRILRENLALAK